MRGRTAVAVLALALTGLVACGIPTDSEPRPLADGPTTTVEVTASAPAQSPNQAFLYLSHEGELSEVLARVERKLEDPPSVESVLNALLAGLTGDELNEGYDTLIPRDTRLVDASVDGTQATIELTADWNDIRGESALGAYAQVVLTATELDGIESVRFVSEGTPIPAPTTIESDKDVVTRADYSSLDPLANGELLPGG